MKELKNDLKLLSHMRKIPQRLVILDNVPTLTLYVLGVVIIHKFSTISAIFFGLYAIFSVTGFVIIPAISKLVGCRNCAIKEDCPWMAINKKD